MIGPSYQASVPSGMAEYEGDALPYENEDKLLWDPNALQFNDVEEYLSKTQESLQQASGGVASIPLGAHVRDDEQVRRVYTMKNRICTVLRLFYRLFTCCTSAATTTRRPCVAAG